MNMDGSNFKMFEFPFNATANCKVWVCQMLVYLVENRWIDIDRQFEFLYVSIVGGLDRKINIQNTDRQFAFGLCWLRYKKLKNYTIIEYHRI